MPSRGTPSPSTPTRRKVISLSHWPADEPPGLGARAIESKRSDGDLPDHGALLSFLRGDHVNRNVRLRAPSFRSSIPAIRRRRCKRGRTSPTARLAGLGELGAG